METWKLLIALHDDKIKKGSHLWGTITHLIYYGNITIRTLSEAPFKSNAPNDVIRQVHKFLDRHNDLKFELDYEWKQNPNTKSRYKEFFLAEVA